VRRVRRADFLTIKNSCSSHHRLGFRPGVSTYKIVQICETTSKLMLGSNEVATKLKIRLRCMVCLQIGIA
jgi:hypothetical protein